MKASAGDSHAAGNGHVQPDAGKQRGTNGKLIGGVTGKGFMPGQCGNPNGRPKRTEAFGQTIRAWLDAPDKQDKAKRARIVTLIERLYTDDPKTLLAYGFGKPVEMIELTGAEGQPIEFRLGVPAECLP